MEFMNWNKIKLQENKVRISRKVNQKWNTALNPRIGMNDLRVAAKRLYSYNLAVQPNETIVIITDDSKSRIADALYKEGQKLYGCDYVHKVTIPGYNKRNDSSPIPIIPELDTADIFLAPTKRSVTHSNEIVKAIINGTRGFSMPGIREYDFLWSAYIDKEITKKIATCVEERLRDLDEITIISAKGASLAVDVDWANNIPFIDDGDVSNRGKVGNIPFGEYSVLPKYGKGDGKVALSFSSENIGKYTLQIENGRIVDWDNNAKPFVNLLKEHKNGDMLAELGFGINPAVECNPYNPYFDPLKTTVNEKCLYTIHLGFGTNITFGGKSEAKIHKDGVIGTKKEPPMIFSEGEEIRLWKDYNTILAIFEQNPEKVKQDFLG
jgi:hypothetical protein